MRRLFIIILSLFALSFFSCSDEKTVDNAAAIAAKEYYDSLLAGNHAYFGGGMYLPDTIPDNYREQLEANASMFVERMGKEHHGINEIRVMRCVNDTIPSADGRSHVRTAEAFLVFSLGDSLNEEVVVPMIQHGGRWLMR